MPEDPKEPSLWWVLAAGALGGAVLLTAYVHFRTGFVVGTLEAHANLGSALEPAVAFLTLLAVVAALWSVQVQRAELALQRKELQETREEMVEQRKQFERTADAQDRLAQSQSDLARAQAAANSIAAEAVEVARRGNAAVALAAVARSTHDRATMPKGKPTNLQGLIVLADTLMLLANQELAALNLKASEPNAEESEAEDA